MSDKEVVSDQKTFVRKLINCSDESGELKLTLKGEGKLSKNDLHSDDVFMVDSETALFVWIGKKASKNEKREALGIANNYLIKESRPWIAITVLNEGQEESSFTCLFE